ncbi:MAG TPA: hypothetical protein VLG38_01545, partial [Gammaproteobacteria bacterium]|nr:hypothetical protein [Gammaproteobacteria bacterium]
MFAKFHVLFEPFWHKSRANRVKTGLFVLTNVALQAAIYFATIPQTDDPEAKASAELANLKALIIPMFANSAQMMIFMNMQAAVCGPLQGSIVQRLLGTHNEFDENVFNNIGSVHTLASEEVKDAIQDLGLHVDNASRFLYIAGTLFNIVPMGLYWRTAERSLPAEARNVLYTATAITGLMCVVQKILTDRVALYRKHAMEEDSKFRTRIQADFRSNDAVVACTYQNAESKILIASTQAKQTSAHRYAIALGTAKAINNIMGLGLMNILRIVVGDAYPEVKGTAQLDTFSIAITFFATALLQIIYSLATDYTLATIGLDKITKINNFLNEIEELNSSPFLDISYEQEFDNADAIVRFSDYTLAIPKQNMSATVIDRINTTLNDPHGTFLYYKSNFDIKKATCERIFGPSGTGKSTMFRSMHGIWPYASGKISFACKRDEIYVMPQDQLFVHGTLLENIYYPYPVPNKF